MHLPPGWTSRGQRRTCHPSWRHTTRGSWAGMPSSTPCWVRTTRAARPPARPPAPRAPTTPPPSPATKTARLGQRAARTLNTPLGPIAMGSRYRCCKRVVGPRGAHPYRRSSVPGLSIAAARALESSQGPGRNRGLAGLGGRGPLVAERGPQFDTERGRVFSDGSCLVSRIVLSHRSDVVPEHHLTAEYARHGPDVRPGPDASLLQGRGALALRLRTLICAMPLQTKPTPAHHSAPRCRILGARADQGCSLNKTQKLPLITSQRDPPFCCCWLRACPRIAEHLQLRVVLFRQARPRRRHPQSYDRKLLGLRHRLRVRGQEHRHGRPPGWHHSP